MRLCSIRLQNFRQFYGEQKIEFARGNENITVILGENGDGKTGIFRAIVFCLFNETELPKDKTNRGNEADKVHLVNLNSLKENIGQPVEATVELIFEDKNKKYFLERTVYDMQDPSGHIQRNLDVEVKLTIQQENGNIEEVIRNNAEVAKVINSILNNRVKDLFFFDGDKIEALSSTNTASREEIKNGIMRLLQIDDIKRAIDLIERLKNDQRRLLRGKADTKLLAKEKELETLKANILEKEKRLDSQKLEQERVLAQIEQYEAQQQADLPMKELFAQRDEIMRSKKMAETILDRNISEIQSIVNQKGLSILLEDLLYRTKNFIVQEELNGEFHSGITVDLLDEILSSQQCICGTRFEEGDAVYDRLGRMKKKYEKMKLSEFIRDFKRNVNASLELGRDIDLIMSQQLREYANQVNEVEKLSKKISDIDRQKSEFSNSEERLRGLENSLKRCREDAAEINKVITVLEHEIKTMSLKVLDQEADIKELRKKDIQLKNDNRMLEYYEALGDIFIQIRDSYSAKMRARLSKEATEIFEELISRKDKSILSQISVNEHYELQAKGWNEVALFQDISSGQKQMLSLSFVAALARVAAGGKEAMIDMPLFMDTPFGKLSGENRDSLITKMPDLTSQWILLVTDTEFAQKEVLKMQQTNKWGRFYKLEKQYDGYTKLKQIHEIKEYCASR